MECRNKIALINDCPIASLKSQNGSYEKLCKTRARDHGMESNLELRVWGFAATEH